MAEGQCLGGDVLHQPQHGMWDGEAGAGSTKATLATLHTWMDVTGIPTARAGKSKLSIIDRSPGVERVKRWRWF